MDLVGTCPKSFWTEWLAEGDCAGAPRTGHRWSWYTRSKTVRLIIPGDRFYIVAHGKLRGFAPVVAVYKGQFQNVIYRESGAEAVTIPEPIPGFQGIRKRWWSRDIEVPFPEWKNP